MSCPWLLCASLLAIGFPALAAEEMDAWRVLPPRTAERKSPSDLYQYFLQAAERAIADREAAYEKLKTPDDVAAWQRQRREIFLRALGEFPGRTPLNAKTVGVVKGDGFRVEKVLFESRPRHHVAGNLYLPATLGPYPGVIVPCGHSYTGKAADGYQRVSMLLAKNGIAAFCYDPIGQGERYQTFGADGAALGYVHDVEESPYRRGLFKDVAGEPHFDPVEEHTLMGMGAILVGTNTAQYRIFDGMRAIDYLVSRGDIDPKRIGCTGNSGGGTLTAYLMALDDRIACAAPACYVTSFRRLLATSGPQDAEQNLFGQLRDGLDETDYVLMRAPVPIALCAGTRDATFDITGTWDVFRQAKRVYARFGFPERVDLVEADEPHGFTKPLRVGATRWMRRWLMSIDDAIAEPELPVFKPSELYCTPEGQVLKLEGEVSVFEWNRRAAEELAAQRAELWKDVPAALRRVRELAGIRPRDEIPLGEVKEVTLKSERQRPGIAAMRGLIAVSDRTIPSIVFHPAKPTGRRVLYLQSSGKHIDAGAGGPIERLTADGAIVMAVDLAGLGETAVPHPRAWGGHLFPSNAQEFFLAYLMGQSLVGVRAEEILVTTKLLETMRVGDELAKPLPVEVIAVSSETGIAALHAAALEPQHYGTLTLRNSLDSWLTVLANPTDGAQLTNTVHAALTAYDLPDLLRTLPRHKIVIERKSDGAVSDK